MAKKCKTCDELKKRVDDLNERLAYLEFELSQSRADKFNRQNKKKEAKEKPAPDPKPKGAKKGHKGWFRKKAKPDKIIDVQSDICPHCQNNDLNEYFRIEEHTQEDIIIPSTEVTLFKKHTYYCKTCKKSFTAKAENELSNSHIGPNAKSLACFLKYSVRTSDINIQELFTKVFNLKIKPSSIAGFRDQLHREALPVYHKLIKSLRAGKLSYSDETGWRVDGDNRWMWKHSNKKVSVSCIRKGRGQKEVHEIYVGVTNDLVRRVWEHKESLDSSSFTSKYNINKLVYYEYFEDITEAIAREKQIKGGSRKKKEDLIQSMNPSYTDLYLTII